MCYLSCLYLALFFPSFFSFFFKELRSLLQRWFSPCFSSFFSPCTRLFFTRGVPCRCWCSLRYSLGAHMGERKAGLGGWPVFFFLFSGCCCYLRSLFIVSCASASAKTTNWVFFSSMGGILGRGIDCFHSFFSGFPCSVPVFVGGFWVRRCVCMHVTDGPSFPFSFSLLLPPSVPFLSFLFLSLQFPPSLFFIFWEQDVCVCVCGRRWKQRVNWILDARGSSDGMVTHNNTCDVHHWPTRQGTRTGRSVKQITHYIQQHQPKKIQKTFISTFTMIGQLFVVLLFPA